MASTSDGSEGTNFIGVHSLDILRGSISSLPYVEVRLNDAQLTLEPLFNDRSAPQGRLLPPVPPFEPVAWRVMAGPVMAPDRIRVGKNIAREYHPFLLSVVCIKEESIMIPHQHSEVEIDNKPTLLRFLLSKLRVPRQPKPTQGCQILPPVLFYLIGIALLYAPLTLRRYKEGAMRAPEVFCPGISRYSRIHPFEGNAIGGMPPVGTDRPDEVVTPRKA